MKTKDREIDMKGIRQMLVGMHEMKNCRNIGVTVSVYNNYTEMVLRNALAYNYLIFDKDDKALVSMVEQYVEHLYASNMRYLKKVFNEDGFQW